MSAGWRVFAGDGTSGDPAAADYVNTVVDDWATARDMLVERLRRFQGDICEMCRAAAAAGVAALLDAQPGDTVELEVEGDSYVLMPAAPAPYLAVVPAGPPPVFDPAEYR